MSDDESLDLSAWEAPPPPPGFADAVVARLRDGTNVGAVVPLDHDAPRARPSWRIVALAAGSAAVGMIGTIVAFELLDRAPEQRVVEISPPLQPAVGRRPVAPAGATNADIDRVIRAHAGAFRACYQQHAGASGKIVVSFDIDADGRVLDPSIASSTMNDDAVQRCIVREVAALAFPASGGLTHVDYPFAYYAPVAKTVAPPPSPSPPAACDADALAAAGRMAFNSGSYSQAVQSLEASLRCKDDPGLYKLTYLTVCRAGFGSKVARYYKLASAGGKSTAAPEQSCIANHLDPHTGQTTPVQLAVSVGRHKVTFVLASGDRYTYTIHVKAGETSTLSKDLE